MAAKGSKYTEDGLRGQMKDSGKTAAELDAARRRNIAYEYLCHLEEARKWLEACLNTELPPASEIEQALRNGIILVKLARFFAPDVVSDRHIYDIDEAIYKDRGLVFRHTDNIAQWLRAMEDKKFPKIFYPEVTDIYDKKNMPRAIYCLHALSRYLFHLGIAPEIEDLKGIAQFTEEQISAMDAELAKAGVQMPKFGKIGGILAKEIGADAAAMHAAILAINQAIENRAPADELIKLLRGLAAGLENVEAEFKQSYWTDLYADREVKVAAFNSKPDKTEEKDIYDTNLTQGEIQKVINRVNATASAERKRQLFDEAIASINAAIASGDATKTIAALQNPNAQLTDVDREAAFQYQVALSDKKGSGQMTQAQIQDCVDEVNGMVEDQRKVDAACAVVRQAILSDDADQLLTALREHQALLELPPIQDYAVEYLEGLKPVASARDEIFQNKLREAITAVNNEQDKKGRFLAALTAANAAIDGGDPDVTLKSLQNPDLELKNVDPAGGVHYQFMLGEAKKQLDGLMLSQPQIQEEITRANIAAEENAKHAAAIFALNETIRAGKQDATLKAMSEPATRVQSIDPACADRYQQRLGAALAAKEAAAGGAQTKWKKFVTKDGRVYFANKETKESVWVPPPDVNDALLTLAEIQQEVTRCNADYARENMFKANEGKIIDLQAKVRGFLARKAFSDRLKFLNAQGDVAVKLQAATRGHQQRKKYKQRLDFLNSQVSAALKIQAGWKGYKVRNQYTNLTKVTDPPVATVRKFLHLLDQSEVDFSEELSLQQLKEKVVKEIKQNHQLEHDLNQMDIKIGLLVRNRIELQDVVKQSKLLKKQNAMNKGSGNDLLGSQANLKSLNKEARERLESYQHLFYLLQTNPSYLASLVFIEQPLERWTAHKAATFLQHVIQTTYNYASNSREKYLLLKLYRTALRKEVFEKIISVKDFITGNPTVVKLVINQYRGSGGESYLSDTLVPLIPNLLAQEDLDLNTDPVDVYKRWINKQEAESGNKSDLPYEVERDEALKHEYVRTQIDATMSKLLELVTLFQDTIIRAMKKLPFGLRYICMCLKSDLHEKFPDVPADDITKVLGNVLYYRYMNPAIIAPEAFGVIEVNVKESVNQTQRRNLASIARVLQFAASGQKFDEELAHMSSLNKFLTDSWAKFKKYFEEAASVESSEEHFNIDEYSDVTMLSKPVVYISHSEIYNTHELLAANIDVVAPSADDPLREILHDLGDIGDEATVLGLEGSPQLAASKMEISLTLTNKFEVPEEEDSSVKTLFVRTKRMVVDVIRFQQGKNLKVILETPATAAEEAEHAAHARERQEQERKLQESQAAADEDAMKRINSSSATKQQASEILSLADLKQKILTNAAVLEKEGLCTASNNYQDLLNSVAQDIRNQRIYRRQRKQELSKLKSTLDELGKKRQYFSEQVDSYDLYVQSCLSELAKGKGGKKSGFMGLFSRNKGYTDEQGHTFGTFKYNAQKLVEKGVLVSVENVSESRLKSVTIEIASQEVGVFTICATIMGVKTVETQLVFQELLQQQYENVQNMKLFDGQVTVNINLLIFLINKKFFGK